MHTQRTFNVMQEMHYHNYPKYWDILIYLKSLKAELANSADPDQTALIRSTLFAVAVVVIVLFHYVHCKQLWLRWDGQVT